MKIVAIGGTGVTGSKFVERLGAHRRHLLHLYPLPLGPTTADQTDAPDDWQDDGAVGMRGWYY